MIAYFDSSAVVPLMIEEPTSQTAGRLWDEARRVASVRLLYPEGRAALAQAERMGRLSAKDHRGAIRHFERLFDQVDVVEVSGRLARRAGDLAQSHALRGYNSVHLAAVEALGETDVVLVAGDGELRDAARTLGIVVANLSRHP